jgi:hypothetical protein
MAYNLRAIDHQIIQSVWVMVALIKVDVKVRTNTPLIQKWFSDCMYLG